MSGSLDRLTLRFSGLEPVPTANDGLVVSNRGGSTADNLKNLIDSLKGGARLNPVSLRCDIQPVSASGTLTIASGSGSVGGTINGTSVTVTWATSDTASAAALAVAINAAAGLVGYVTATSALGVVTITAADSGLLGNAITLVASGTGVTASGARLTAGTNGTAQVALAQATGTFTYSSSSGSTVATLNGVAFTQASGSDAARGTALAAAIAASANPALMGLTASDNGSGVVTVTGLANGQWAGANGNSISLVVSGTGLARSGANATGGADPVTYSFTY